MKYLDVRVTFLALAATIALHGSALAQRPHKQNAWAQARISESAEHISALNHNPSTREARQKYSIMTDETVPPELAAMNVRFPPDARRLGRSVGPLRVVQLSIVVERDGRAREVEMVKSSGFDRYDAAAKQAAREATYLPALNRGTPVESRMEYEVSFGLLCNRAAGTRPDCEGGRFPQECSATVCALLLR